MHLECLVGWKKPMFSFTSFLSSRMWNKETSNYHADLTKCHRVLVPLYAISVAVKDLRIIRVISFHGYVTRPLPNSQITTCAVSMYVSNTTSAIIVSVSQGFV